MKYEGLNESEITLWERQNEWTACGWEREGRHGSRIREQVRTWSTWFHIPDAKSPRGQQKKSPDLSLVAFLKEKKLLEGSGYSLNIAAKLLSRQHSKAAVSTDGRERRVSKS